MVMETLATNLWNGSDDELVHTRLGVVDVLLDEAWVYHIVDAVDG